MGLFDNAKDSAMSGLLNTVMQSDEVQQGIQIATDAKNTLILTANRFDKRFGDLEALAIAQGAALVRIEEKLNKMYDNLFADVRPAESDGLMKMMGDDFPVTEHFDPIPVTNVPSLANSVFVPEGKSTLEFKPIPEVSHETESFEHFPSGDLSADKPN